MPLMPLRDEWLKYMNSTTNGASMHTMDTTIQNKSTILRSDATIQKKSLVVDMKIS